MFNIEMEYMKSYAQIAINALNSMSLVWEQMQFNDTEPSILSKNYPLNKSFDEFVFDFSEWVSDWVYN